MTRSFQVRSDLREKHKSSTHDDCGTRAARKRPNGLMPLSPNCGWKIDWPAGLGALAITVRPPPAMAPATTANFNSSVNPGNERGEIGDGGVVIEGSEHHGADHQRPFSEIAKHWSNPPSLASSMDHQRCEKKSNKHRAAQIDRALMALGRDDEGEEEQEAKNHQGGIMCVEHRPDDRQKMHRRNEWRNGPPAFVFGVGPISSRPIPCERPEEQGVRQNDAHDGFPSKIRRTCNQTPNPTCSRPSPREGRQNG